MDIITEATKDGVSVVFGSTYTLIKDFDPPDFNRAIDFFDSVKRTFSTYKWSSKSNFVDGCLTILVEHVDGDKGRSFWYTLVNDYGFERGEDHEY